MKAAVRYRYGLPGDLSIKEVEIPKPKDNEVLIRVRATTVNRSDCHELSGLPLFMRLFTGLTKPRRKIIGSDFAGDVEAIGANVRSFKVGDKIMGFSGGLGCGCHAEYFTLPEDKAKKMMVTMPSNITYDQAAACLEGVVYAGQMMRTSKPQRGQKALVYGATGAIGVAYLQILKSHGLYVTAVCRSAQADLVRSLGADKVVDYTKEDFTNDPERYDFVFDAVGKSTFLKCRKLLKEKGIYSSSGGAINILWVLVTPLFGGKRVGFPRSFGIATELNIVKGLLEQNRFTPVIDRKYPLEEIAEAYRYVIRGEKVGNVIITMD